MLKYVLYYFTPCQPASNLLAELLEMKERGEHLGHTYPPSSTHTCFSSDQEAKLKRLLGTYTNAGVHFERSDYFDGNLSGDDFNISTFRQPIIQWCPRPIITAYQKKVFNKGVPWGLTMDGFIALPISLREIIQKRVLGLERDVEGPTDQFDLYRIKCRMADISNEDHSKTPLAVDGTVIPASLDIWHYKSGIILCSQRFGRLLNSFWDGFPEGKFQPVICTGFSEQLTAKLCSPISLSSIPNNNLKHIRTIERLLELKFPKRYIDFLIDHPVVLPMGWLKIEGGLDSILIKVMQDEHQSAEPSMPPDLVPIYAYGNGDYICLQRNLDDLGTTFVDWSHEDGRITELSEDEFEELLD